MVLADAKPERRGSGRADRAFGRQHPDGAACARAQGSRQSRGRQQLRFAIVEGARLCAAGQMGGGAREIQERRIRHHRAAGRPAAHRDHGSDARLARGQGLFRRRQAQERSRRHRHSAGDAARDRGDAWPARRGARPRQGCARRIQARRRFARPAGGGRSQAVRGRAAAAAQRDQPARCAARTGDAAGVVARRRPRGAGAGEDGEDLCRYRALRRVADGGAHRHQNSIPIRNWRAPVRMRRRPCSRRYSSATRATTCRRSTRSGCFTIFAN